jgi:hypothetical protein
MVSGATGLFGQAQAQAQSFGAFAGNLTNVFNNANTTNNVNIPVQAQPGQNAGQVASSVFDVFSGLVS